MRKNDLIYIGVVASVMIATMWMVETLLRLDDQVDNLTRDAFLRGPVDCVAPAPVHVPENKTVKKKTKTVKA